jgi:hypothetical protein
MHDGRGAERVDLADGVRRLRDSAMRTITTNWSPVNAAPELPTIT